MNKQDLYDILFQQYLTLNENKDTLISEAQTAVQAEQILGAWRQANLNQLTMGNKILGEGTPAVGQLANQVDGATTQINSLLADLQQQAGNLEVLSQTVAAIQTAVSLGTQLVAAV